MEKLEDDLSKYILKKSKNNIKYDLDRIKKVAKNLGNPHKAYKVIHIAGTNGKGSVTKMISNILIKQGYLVGTFISPHVLKYNERILVNLKQIKKNQVKELADIVFDTAKKIKVELSFFEVTTLIAFLYFKKLKVDYAVIEVGLGGRLDATNIVNSKINIITNIGLDHTKILGKKIQDIAKEKAGIIKKNSKVYSFAKGKSKKIIKQITESKNSIFIDCNKNVNNRYFKDGIFNFKTKNNMYDIKPKYLFAKYQEENIILSTLVCEDLNINKNTIKNAIINTKNLARFQLVQNNPKIILDSAHNVFALKSFLSSIKETNIKKKENLSKTFFICSFSKDKDIKNMLKEIDGNCDLLICSQFNFFRSLKADILFKMAKKTIKKSKIKKIENISDAIYFLKNVSKKQDLICIFGSIYMMDETKLI